MQLASHSVVALVASVAFGCGRFGFEAVAGDAIDTTDATDATGDGPVPDLVVVDSPTEMIVTVEGRFAMRFGFMYDWFAVDWRDATAPDEPLVSTRPDLDKAVLQGVMIEMPLVDFQGTGAGQNRTLQIFERGPERLKFTAGFELDYGADVIDVEVDNTLDRDGNWKIAVTVSSIAGATTIDNLEIADSHVSDAVVWTQASSPGSYTWRRDGAGLRATLRCDGPPGLATQSDETNNLYFTEPDLAMPVTREWTCVIWPPT